MCLIQAKEAERSSKKEDASMSVNCGDCFFYWDRIWQDRLQADGYCKLHEDYPQQSQKACGDWLSNTRRPR